MGRFDDPPLTSVDDERLEGFTLDARKMFVADAEAKRAQQRAEASTTPKQQDTTEAWRQYIDGCINRALNRFWDNIEAEVAKNLATRDDLKKLREEMHREITRASNKLIIFDSSDPHAKKHLSDDPNKVLNWNDARRRG